jgi:hypothetical protein
MSGLGMPERTPHTARWQHWLARPAGTARRDQVWKEESALHDRQQAITSPSSGLQQAVKSRLLILMIVYRQLHHLMIAKQHFAYIKTF